MEQISDKQVKDTKPHLGRKRMVVSIIGVGLVLALAGGAGAYVKMKQEDDTEENRGQQWKPDGGYSMGENIVTASGTTSIGVDAVTFAIDFLEDTSLYVEEVYLSSGDEVQAGEKYLKFNEDSIEEARSELESAAKEAELAYRSAVITTNESKIEAKYTYQQTLLEAQQAQQVYEDTVASLQASLDAAKDAYTEAQDEYNEYLDAVTNNTFRDDYEIDARKKAYEDAYDLYLDRKEYWEITEEELSQSSSNMTINTVNTSTAGNVSAASESEGRGNAPQNTDGSNTAKAAGGSNAAAKEEQAAKADRQWILKAFALLEEEMEEAKEAYEQAQEDYQDEIDGAQLKLQKLLNTCESKREDYEDAQITFQKESLSAKTTYETTLAKGKTAQNDYDTQITSLNEALEKLEDTKKETQNNLALFEELAGDGYLYTEEAGTILMSRAENGEALAGGDMLFAYSNPDKITVSVAVSQDSIAKLSVGETATVMISDYGNYSGTIESINPIASSDSRTSVSYTVEVALEGDVSALSANLTATVVFGMDADEMADEMKKSVTFNVQDEMPEDGRPQGMSDMQDEMPKNRNQQEDTNYESKENN